MLSDAIVVHVCVPTVGPQFWLLRNSDPGHAGSLPCRQALQTDGYAHAGSWKTPNTVRGSSPGEDVFCILEIMQDEHR
jgi:hypothetical protein